jgi:hypothetical protein
MRYKDLVMTNLEQLQNGYTQLEYLLRQGADRQQILDWFEHAKEKLEHIRSLVDRNPAE